MSIFMIMGAVLTLYLTLLVAAMIGTLIIIFTTKD